MPAKVFVSYSHDQGPWVWDRLVPVLKAGGAEVLIERFAAGRALLGQMDALQDSADVNVLVFSPAYLKSDACVHEMERAIARDPRFTRLTVWSTVKRSRKSRRRSTGRSRSRAGRGPKRSR